MDRTMRSTGSTTTNTQELITLLVGDGNFSYSAALAEQYYSAPGLLESKRIVIATDWKTDGIIGDDPLTLRNIQKIRELGGFVSTSTDATKLEEDEFLLAFDCCKIDQVIFNFPHVQTKKMHIGRNRELLRRFFISVSKLIPDHKKEEHLKVKVSLCNGQSGVTEVERISRRWADSWQLVDQAAHGGFVLAEVNNFQIPAPRNDISGSEVYVNCGFRNRINISFDARDAKTFSFIWRPPFDSPCGPEILPENWIIELHPSNPLKVLVDKLNALELEPTEKIVIEHEIDCTSNITPFVHLWVKNLAVPYLIDKFSSIRENPVADSTLARKRNIERELVHDISNIEVGCIKNNRADVNVTRVLSLMYNIDNRILFSRYCLSEMITGSLYPRTFSIDISFWINETTLYTKESFTKCCLQVYGLSLESVELLEVYKKLMNPEKECDNNDAVNTKVSHCYRLTIRCLDLALSSSKSHELYLQLREDLQNKLELELRIRFKGDISQKRGGDYHVNAIHESTAMSIVIVYLHYESGGNSNGWNVDIHGLIYSQRETFRKQFPAATICEGSQVEPSSQQSQGTCLTVRPHEESKLKSSVREPPLQLITAYLKQIADFGYKVSTTDSTSDNNGCRITTLWTLQK